MCARSCRGFDPFVVVLDYQTFARRHLQLLTLMHRFDYSSLDNVREQVAAYAAVGAQRVMLGWTEFDNPKGITDLGRALC